MAITSRNIFLISAPFLLFQHHSLQNLESPQRIYEKSQISETICQEHAHFHFSHHYQTLFSKNFELLKNKFQRRMSPNFEIDLWKQLYVSVGNVSFFEKMSDELAVNRSVDIMKVYVFLGFITFYEALMEIPHSQFLQNDWEDFARMLCTTREKLLHVNKCLFKNNVKYYKWTQEEDDFLKKLAIKNQNQNNKISWKNLAISYNKGKMVSMARTPSQLKERWENTLKTDFIKGGWKISENLLILDFVKENGTKWAKLARLLVGRNEHQVKNQFFGLLGKFMSISIKTIKKQKNYLSPEILTKARNYFDSEVSKS